jgi:hypothetical protein
MQTFEPTLLGVRAHYSLVVAQTAGARQVIDLRKPFFARIRPALSRRSLSVLARSL